MKLVPRTLSGKILAAQVLLILVTALSSPLWFPEVGYFLVVQDPLEKADAILVLGGGNPARGRTAAELYKDGWATRVVTTGKVVPDYIEALGEKHTFATLTAKAVSAMGVPPRDITVINSGTSTYEEAQAIRRYMEENKFKSIIIVTTCFHTRRARLVYRKMFKDTGIKIIMRPATGGDFRKEEWWNRESNLIMVNNEWVKLILYLFKGMI